MNYLKFLLVCFAILFIYAKFKLKFKKEDFIIIGKIFFLITVVSVPLIALECLIEYLL